MSHPQEIIWLVAHYPDHPEMDERIRSAVSLHEKTQLPIWIFASSTTQYPDGVEVCIQRKLLTTRVDPGKVFMSRNFGNYDCFDTVQEMDSIFTVAIEKGVQKIHCISNRLQLLQIMGLARKYPVEKNYITTALRDRRWWYIGVRLTLIPLAALGIGRNFAPLRLVRHARARWTSCEF